MALELRRHRFTTGDFQCLAKSGVLAEDDRVELIEGEILDMSPIGSRHAAVVDRLTRLFVRGAAERAIVRVQGSIVLDDGTQPQPDLALLQPRDDFYAAEHPGPGDLSLVVEVADSSVDFDRRVKTPLYARAGIAELWLVDLEREHLIVSLEPTGDRYRTTRVVRHGESVSPAIFPDLKLSVDEILGSK